jgi:hypothetical protein
MTDVEVGNYMRLHQARADSNVEILLNTYFELSGNYNADATTTMGIL